MHYISSSVDADLLYIFACSRGHTEATQGKTQTNSIVILKSQLLSLTLGSKTSVKKEGKKDSTESLSFAEGKKMRAVCQPTHDQPWFTWLSSWAHVHYLFNAIPFVFHFTEGKKQQDDRLLLHLVKSSTSYFSSVAFNRWVVTPT